MKRENRAHSTGLVTNTQGTNSCHLGKYFVTKTHFKFPIRKKTLLFLSKISTYLHELEQLLDEVEHCQGDHHPAAEGRDGSKFSNELT